jgi:hypothetical protein
MGAYSAHLPLKGNKMVPWGILKVNLYLTNVQFGVMWYNYSVAGRFDETGMGD